MGSLLPVDPPGLQNRVHDSNGICDFVVPANEASWEDLHVGTEGVFADAGFAEVSRPTLRRAVMRVAF